MESDRIIGIVSDRDLHRGDATTPLSDVMSPDPQTVFADTPAREAVALMGENAYDVILCDLIMPEMTGMDVYRAALQRATPMHDRIVFMTGGAFTQRARDFLESVPNMRIEKPFELGHLERTIYEAADLINPA